MRLRARSKSPTALEGCTNPCFSHDHAFARYIMPLASANPTKRRRASNTQPGRPILSVRAEGAALGLPSIRRPADKRPGTPRSRQRSRLARTGSRRPTRWLASDLSLLPRVMRRIHESRPRGPGAGDLKEDRFALGHREVVHVRRLGPKTARRQGLQFASSKLSPNPTYRVPEITVTLRRGRRRYGGSIATSSPRI